MRVAWFSPLPPTRSGIAAYSAELLERLAPAHDVDTFPEEQAHDFVWRARRHPYDLVVYHLGNAACHDYMWGYLARYPGLVVLHDVRLHHARARCLLDRDRVAEYRDELRYDHPGLNADFAQFAIEGLGGPVYYLWPMVKAAIETARAVAVHSTIVADELRDAFANTTIDRVRMGVPPTTAAPGARERIRAQLHVPENAVVFAAFGKITAEKRISAILTALAALVREGRPAHALLVGDAEGYPLETEIARHGLRERVRVTGHIPDAAVPDHLAAADVCLCLRWPTALESSASWLRCLAAGRATIVTDLAHLVDTPGEAALRVDPADEADSLLRTMRQLTDDSRAREAIAEAGRQHWLTSHTLDHMAADYLGLLPRAASRPAPAVSGLPRHFLDDYSEAATAILRRFDVNVDLSN